MSAEQRIPIPWDQRWRRVCFSVMPGVCFVLALGIVLWLWNRQGVMPNAVGAVEVRSVDVAAGADGIVARIGPAGRDGPWELFEQVHKDQIVAELDLSLDRDLDNKLDEAKLKALNLELAQLNATVDAELLKFEQRVTQVASDYWREERRLEWEIERRILEVLTTTVLIETDRKERDRLEKRWSYLKAITLPEAVTKRDLDDAELQVEVVKTRIEENQKVLKEAVAQRDDLTKLSNDYPDPFEWDKDTLLKPHRVAVAVQEAWINEWLLQMTTLQVKAPIDGRIVKVFYHTGQFVQAGEPIVEIAAKDGYHVVSYIRQNQGFRPTRGMLADLRSRDRGRPRREDLRVIKVGPQFEEIPAHLLNDPRVREWGLPVLIALPADRGLHLRPGELVDVTFKPWTVNDPDS